MSHNQFVTIEGRVLARALADLLCIVEKHSHYPILSMVKLTISESWLSVRGTDLDVEAQLDLDASDAAGAWSTCVNARVLEKIARIANKAIMRIEPAADDDAVTAGLCIGFTGAAYVLDTLPTDSWPDISGDRGQAIEVFGESAPLSQLLRKVAWCVSREETRYYLNGVAWQMDGRGRRMVATDGHRMAMCTYVEPEDGSALGWSNSRIIPNKTVTFLRQMVGGTASVYAVNYATGEHAGAADPFKIEIVSDNLTVRSKLVEGTFPDVDRVVPKSEKRTAAFQMKQPDLVTALSRALVFSDRYAGQGHALKFEPHGGKITVSAKRSEVGATKVEIDGKWPEEGEAFGANGIYLREVIQQCTGGVTIHQIDAAAPMDVLDSDPTMRRILMPMKV